MSNDAGIGREREIETCIDCGCPKVIGKDCRVCEWVEPPRPRT